MKKKPNAEPATYTTARLPERDTSLWTKTGKTQTKQPSNHSLSHERESERSERASERVSAAEGASEASSPEQANE